MIAIGRAALWDARIKNAGREDAEMEDRADGSEGSWEGEENENDWADDFEMEDGSHHTGDRAGGDGQGKGERKREGERGGERVLMPGFLTDTIQTSKSPVPEPVQATAPDRRKGFQAEFPQREAKRMREKAETAVEGEGSEKKRRRVLETQTGGDAKGGRTEKMTGREDAGGEAANPAIQEEGSEFDVAARVRNLEESLAAELAETADDGTDTWKRKQYLRFRLMQSLKERERLLELLDGVVAKEEGKAKGKGRGGT
jgi:hypothetical protein